MVIDGGIRDTQRIFDMEDFNAFVRGFDPSAINDVSMPEINGVTRIGNATCLPGDVVLGTRSGVIFIPPHLAQEVVESSENVRLKDEFGQQRIMEGVYTPGEVDREFSDKMNADFENWKKKQKEVIMPTNKNDYSKPSDLKITDMRISVVGHGGWRWPIIKLYTNQDIVGIGEVRDGASAKYALSLKSRLLGENPCDIDKIFQKIKQFGGHGRLGGGVCGVEMALCDLAGKAYGIPAYMLAGGKYRNKIKVYADTPLKKDPEEMGKALRKGWRMGLSF
ncbi:MAG: hypothetical protein Ct9H90mP2_05850 [Dehalococcoidia bacterium]|nr:MAG: hypothetical protein Ct9H90mP2_05850 [Dehalococcoidia bacterium]